MNNTERKILAVLMVTTVFILGWIWFQSLGGPENIATNRIEDKLEEYQKIVEKCSKKLDTKNKALCDKELLEVSHNLSILELELKNLNSGFNNNNASTSTSVGR